MAVNNTTNLNVKNSGDIPGNQDVDNASAPTKTAGPNPVNNSKGIAEVSNAEDDFITTFPDAPKPSLREPEVPARQLAEQPMTLTSEVAKMLNLSTQTTLGEFITVCTNKLNDTIGKMALNDKIREAGGNPEKFDSEILDCMVLLITADSKSKLIETLKKTLQSKLNERNAANQKLIEKNVEVGEKNAQAIKEKEAAEAKAKLWGIFGAIFSAVAAVFACAVTVATCGVGTGAAIAVTTLAIAGCGCTCVGSACTIAGLAMGGEDGEKMQKVGMGFGIAGAVFSLAGGLGSFKVIAGNANTLLKIMSSIASLVSGVTSSTGQITQGVAQKHLAETEKELSDMKISLEKLNNQIDILSTLIDRIANSIQDFMKDLFQDEQEVSQMVQKMMQTALGIEQNVKC